MTNALVKSSPRKERFAHKTNSKFSKKSNHNFSKKKGIFSKKNVTSPHENNENNTKEVKKSKCFVVSQKIKKGPPRKDKPTCLPLSIEMTESLNSKIDINAIERDGFSFDTWKVLTFDEKCSLRQYIGSLLNKIDVPKEEAAAHRFRKRKIALEVGKYEKKALHRFYNSRKSDIKKLKKEKSLSGTDSVNSLWNSLSSSEKHEWLNQTSAHVEGGVDEDEVVVLRMIKEIPMVDLASTEHGAIDTVVYRKCG